MPPELTFIGRVTRCSTRGFVGAVRLPQPELPAFGGLCWAEAQQGQTQVIGVIYNISIEDDEFARQMAATEDLAPEHIHDQQTQRQVPIEYAALTLGYRHDDRYAYRLPPQPPLTLARIHALNKEQVLTFTQRLDFLPLLLAAEGLPVDEVLIATLRQAAGLRPANQRREYLVQAGRACARHLSNDLTRLATLLAGLELDTDAQQQHGSNR